MRVFISATAAAIVLLLIGVLLERAGLRDEPPSLEPSAPGALSRGGSDVYRAQMAEAPNGPREQVVAEASSEDEVEVTRSELSRQINDAATRAALRAQGKTELEIRLMFAPAKHERFIEIVEYYRAVGDAHALEHSINNAIIEAVATQLESRGLGPISQVDGLGVKELLESGLEVFTLNGRMYVFQEGLYPIWDHFRDVRDCRTTDSLFSAQWLHDKLHRLASESTEMALAATGGIRIEYEHPWGH